MLIAGLPLLPVVLVTALGVAILIALQWLKTRYPGHVIASTMLWREALQASRPRALWQRLSRPLSLLAPLLALLAVAAAVLEPVWDSQPTPVAIVYERSSRQAALKVFDRQHPLRRYLILAEADGIITETERIRPDSVLPAVSQVPTNYRAVAALAQRLAGTAGQVIWFGQTPPPQLPPGCAFIASKTSSTPTAMPPRLNVRLLHAPKGFADLLADVPGLTVTDSKDDADLTYAFPPKILSTQQAAEDFFQALHATGLYREEADDHQQEVPEKTTLPNLHGSLSLSSLLFLLALLSYLADLWLWSQRRTV